MKGPKTATIKLDYPVQLADRELTEVTMHRPSMGEITTTPCGTPWTWPES